MNNSDNSRNTNNPASDTSLSLDVLSQIMGLIFPDSTQLLGVDVEEGLDSAISLKIKLSYRDCLLMSQQGLLKDAVYIEKKRYLLGDDAPNRNTSWWNPSAPVELPVTQIQLPDIKVLNLGMTHINTTDVHVYLFWHST